MKNDKSLQCPKGINILLVSVTVPSEAKGRKSRMRRLIIYLDPDDFVTAYDEDGVFLFKLSVHCFGKVSTVVSLDK